ncbi:MAG: VOC family protein [Acidobacteria bacterium]|nr:MAG: VOC family protein [Acidobacteriota bacterium]REJ98167.1 MAG: VOC family protein [Acidobacteriota bacterium]REK16910.1 MAG: VOC family protein [Acidobacteriota bacterium]REK42821.1 MAG: VOC family protein [Acidobacteriota bacterium]
MAEQDRKSWMKDITPMLEVSDLDTSIRFYQEKLGFECQGVYPEDGEACWASMRCGNAYLMLTVRSPHSTVESPTFTGTFYFYPENVNDAWERFKNGVEVEYPIEDFEYGMREFGIRDPDGYLLQFGQGLEELS